MTNIEEIYRKLTNVDITEQKVLWDERGRGYYGEFLVFCELYPHLPGNCKILMNLNIPTVHGKTTEIDLLLIHESGLYVFEMKHYKGTIYGKPHEQNWTQYFRTAPNQRFRSPITQNQYHIDALKKIVPDIPIHSYVVFTSNECNLRVECNDPSITVCTLHDLHCKLGNITSRPSVLNMEQINHLFCTLLPYSPTSQQPVNVEGREIPFYEFASSLCSNYIEKEKQLKAEQDSRINQGKKAAGISIGVAAIIALASIVISLIVCTQYKKYSNDQITSAQQELAAFAQKFERVEEYNNGDIQFSSPLVTASNVVLEESKDLANTVNFSCSLNWAGEEYGVRLTNDTKYIIILKDGTIKEYNLFTSDFHCYPTHKIGKGAYSKFDLPKREFYELDVSDIAYIKLINTDIWKHLANYGNSLFTGYEIELYCAE